MKEISLRDYYNVDVCNSHFSHSVKSLLTEHSSIFYVLYYYRFILINVIPYWYYAYRYAFVWMASIYGDMES